jgi:hypothetical protein
MREGLAILPAQTVVELEAFVARHPRLWDPMWAEALAEIVVWEAVRPRLTSSVAAVRGARIVWLLEARDGSVARHCAVVIDSRFLVDLARRAVDPDAMVPYVYQSIDDAGRHWRWLVDGDDPAGVRRALPVTPGDPEAPAERAA